MVYPISRVSTDGHIKTGDDMGTLKRAFYALESRIIVWMVY